MTATFYVGGTRALRQPEATDAFAHKFGVALGPEALMIHLRSRAREKDGRIHADSRDKPVTALLYLNDGWPHLVGCLRLLRNNEDLEEYATEATPEGGFRRCVMFNLMVSKAARRELRRYALSPRMKRAFFSDVSGPG